MPLFPKVTSPCPYKSNLSAVMDGDFCRACQRPVFDLNAMTDDDRRMFLAACDEDEVCVSYRLPMRAAIAAAALAASTPAMAQDPAPEPLQAQLDAEMEMSDMVIIVGGIRNPSHTELTVAAEDPATPEMPVVYEDEAPAPQPANEVDRHEQKL